MTKKTRRAWPWALATTAVAVGAHLYATRRYFNSEAGPTAFMHPDLRTAWTPAWNEMLTGVQWLRLRRSAVFHGDGVPPGDGSPVLLVQGFLTRAIYLETLRGWLERIGYRARVVNLGWSADCYNVLAERVREEAEDAANEAHNRVHLIGHSLGGMLVRAVAAQVPRLVSSVTSLATPFRGLRVHPSLRVGNLAMRAVVHRRRGASVSADCMTLACECATVRALAAPLPASLPQLAVVARGDGVVDWRYEADPATTRVIVVPGSHLGAVFEPVAYEALAHHLALASAPMGRTAADPAAS